MLCFTLGILWKFRWIGDSLQDNTITNSIGKIYDRRSLNEVTKLMFQVGTRTGIFKSENVKSVQKGIPKVKHEEGRNNKKNKTKETQVTTDPEREPKATVTDNPNITLYYIFPNDKHINLQSFILMDPREFLYQQALNSQNSSNSRPVSLTKKKPVRRLTQQQQQQQQTQPMQTVDLDFFNKLKIVS